MASSETMPNKPTLTAYMIAVLQSDATDRVYAVLGRTIDDAVSAVSSLEPSEAKPRYVGTLGNATVRRIKLEAGEVRKI